MKAATCRRLNRCPPWGSQGKERDCPSEASIFTPLCLEFHFKEKVESRLGTGRALDLEESLQESGSLLALQSKTTSRNGSPGKSRWQFTSQGGEGKGQESER